MKSEVTYDLWIIGYGTNAYRKLNWWTSFFFSDYLNQEQLRDGQLLLMGTNTRLPNRWTLLYAGLGADPHRLGQLKHTWTNLGRPTTRLWLSDESLLAPVRELFAHESDGMVDIEVRDSLGLLAQ